MLRNMHTAETQLTQPSTSRLALGALGILSRLPPLQAAPTVKPARKVPWPAPWNTVWWFLSSGSRTESCPRTPVVHPKRSYDSWHPPSAPTSTLLASHDWSPTTVEPSPTEKRSPSGSQQRRNTVLSELVPVPVRTRNWAVDERSHKSPTMQVSGKTAGLNENREKVVCLLIQKTGTIERGFNQVYMVQSSVLAG